MAIIKQKVDIKKEKIKADISQPILSELLEYMAWAKIDDFDHVLEQALLYILEHDKAWTKHKKMVKKIP